MLSVEMLPAGNGDALLVTWGDPGRPHRMLIDGGWAASYPAVAGRLREFDDPIDLLVVSHYDRDHIGGVVRLLDDDELAPRFQAVWFNAGEHVEQCSDLLGVLDADELAKLVVRRGLPWNPGWPVFDPAKSSGPVVVVDQPPVVDVGGAEITLLSPTVPALAALWGEWKPIIVAAGVVAGQPAVGESVDQGGSDLLGSLSLQDLSGLPFRKDPSKANGASIAFVFRYGDKSILFGADAHPDILLNTLGKITPTSGRYPLTACKMPHHGSRRNVSVPLVRALDCAEWWFSTDGFDHGHPNAESIARVLVHGGSPAVLCANYDSDPWQTFWSDYPPDQNLPYELKRPAEGAEGLMLVLNE